MKLGHGHRRSVVILWGWTALLSAFVLYPTLTGRNPAYLPFGIIAAAIVLYTVLHPSVRARRRANASDELRRRSREGGSTDVADEQNAPSELPSARRDH